MGEVPEKLQDQGSLASKTVDWQAIFSKRAPFAVDVIAWLVWGFILIKIFVIDLDNILIGAVFPSYLWVLRFKIIVFTGCIAFIVLFAKTLRWRRWVAYIIFYPFVFLFWNLPISTIRHGSFTFILFVLYIAFSILKSIKVVSAIAFFLMVGAFICVYISSEYVLWPTVAILLLLLLTIFLEQIIVVLKHPAFFEQTRAAIASVHKQTVEKINSATEFPELPLSQNDEHDKTLISMLETAILTNRLLLLGARQLRIFQSSGVVAIASVMATLFLVFLTTFIFTFVNLALYKIDPKNFEAHEVPTVFNFFALSFKALVFSGIDELKPIRPVAEAINIFENMSSIFVITIFVSIIVQSRSERQKLQLDHTVRVAEEKGRLIEEALKARYKKLSLQDILDELTRAKSALVSVITYLTLRIERD